MTDDELRIVAEVTGSVIDDRMAPLARRLERLEEAVGLSARYRAIREHRLFPVVLAALASGEWVPWEWAESLGVTEPELLQLLADWQRGMLA